jgi:hypothetical protein
MTGWRRTFEGIGFVASNLGGRAGIEEWVMVAHDTYHIPTTGGATAVSTPSHAALRERAAPSSPACWAA